MYYCRIPVLSIKDIRLKEKILVGFQSIGIQSRFFETHNGILILYPLPGLYVLTQYILLYT